MHRRLSLPAMFRYSRASCVIWSISSRSDARARLDFPVGLDASLPEHRHPQTKLRPTIRRGCVFGDLSRRHSWDFLPFAGLLPTAGAALSPAPRASMLFADRSPRFVFVAEPSVRRNWCAKKDGRL